MKANDAITWVIKFLLNYLIGFLLLFFLYNSIKTIKEIITCIIILVSSTIISSFVVLYQAFFNPVFGNFEPWITSGRFNATFTDPNALGSFTVLAFPLFLVLIIYYKKWYIKVSFSILFLLFLPLIYFAGSRSALIGILISIIVFIIIGLRELFKTSRRNRSLILIIIAIILIIIILASILLIKTDNKLKIKIAASGIVMKTIETIKAAVLYFRIDSLAEAIKSISNYRYMLWKRALQMVRDYPLSGVGSGAFIIELPDYNWKYDKAFLQVDYPGNYYLQIFAEFGLPGLILLLAIYALIIKKFINYKYFIKKNNITDKNKIIIYGLFASFISMVIILIFGSHINMVEIQITFWLIIGLICSYIKIYKEKTILNSIVNLKEFELSSYNNFYDISIKEIFKEKLVRNKSRLISFIIILVIFITSFAYYSCNNLSINIKQNLFKWSDLNHTNSYGFYNVENGSPDGPRWISYDASISIKKTGDIFSFALKAKNPDLAINPLYVKIYIDNTFIKEFKLVDNNWHKYTLKLPKTNRNAITLTIVPSRTWNPQKLGIGNDNRDLGIMVGNIEFLK
ncbi:MAG: O-antigen ligase family protein [Candidatus Humimicrobiaceae bacterium]